MGIIFSILGDIITYPLPYGKKSENLADYPKLFSGNMLIGTSILIFVGYALFKKNDETDEEIAEENDQEAENYNSQIFHNLTGCESFCSSCYSTGRTFGNQLATDLEGSDKSSEISPKSIYTLSKRTKKHSMPKRHSSKRFRSKVRNKPCRNDNFPRPWNEKKRSSSTNLNIITHLGTIPGLFKRDFNKEEEEEISNPTIETDSETELSFGRDRFTRADSPPHTRSGRIYNDLSSNDINLML